MREERDSAMGRPPRRRMDRWAFLVAVLLLVALAPDAQAGDPLAPGGLDAVFFPSAPVIDGDLSEWPGGEGHVARLDSSTQLLADRPGPWEGAEDLSAQVQVGTDPDALLLAIRIEDDEAFHPGHPWWHGDGLELFLDLDHGPGTERPTRYSPHCWQIFLMPRNPELAWGVAFHGTFPVFDDGGLRGIALAHRERPGGYDIEARIPWRQLGLEGREAREIGFALALNDADTAPAHPGTYMSFNGLFDLYRNPANFSTLRLPSREPPTPRGSVAEGAGTWSWGVAVFALALLGVLLLAGPGARAMARVGPGPKLAALGLVGLLALVFTWDQARTEASARDDVTRRLERLSQTADDVAREAAELGALPADPQERSQALADLLRGASIPSRIAPEAVAYVPLVDWEVARETWEGAYDLRLERAHTFLLPRPERARTLEALVDLGAVAARDDDALEKLELGTLTLLDGEAGAEALPVVVDAAEVGRHRVRLDLGEGMVLRRLGWAPAPGARQARLLGMRIVDDRGEATPLLLSQETEDGVPILGGPGAPPLGVTLDAGDSATFEMPALTKADRLWLVLSARGAFPRRLGDDVLGTVAVAYAEGETETTDLLNGEHLAAETQPPGLVRPSDMASRVAYRFADSQGLVRSHDAVALKLDPARHPRAFRLTNHGQAGPLQLLAATLVGSGTPPPTSLLGSAPGPGGLTDTLFLRAPEPAFAEHLGPGEADAVRLDRTVAEDLLPTRLTLSAPLPARARDKRDRTHIALLACLAIALLILAFLAADAVEHSRRLSLRLAAGVLVAALLPLAATVFLVDRTTKDRLESEQAARARATLQAVDVALRDAQRRTQTAAANLTRHLVREPDLEESGAVARLVRLYRRGAFPPGAASLAIVASADRPAVTVPEGRAGARLLAPRYLAELGGEGGVHVSPWDGLLLVGTARRGRSDAWVRVSLGVRVDDVLLADLVAGALADDDTDIALLDGQGTPLAATGADSRPFLHALAQSRDAVDAALARQSDVVLPRVALPDGTSRMAVVMPVSDTLTPLRIAAGLDRSAIESALATQREHLAWLSLFGLLLVVGVASLTARRVADPIRGLVRVTEAVRRGEFDVHVAPAGRDEVGDLSVAFDQMRRDLKHRVADLDFLRRAQDGLALSLDYGRRAEQVLDYLGESFSPDASLLIDATSPGLPLTVAAERGRRTAFGDRAFTAAPGGWLRASLESDGPVDLPADGEDPRVEAEGGLGRRLVEDRPAWVAVPLQVGGERAGLAVLAYDDPADLPRGEGRRLLEPLAGVCALALYNARLYRLAALDDVTRLPGATAFEAAVRTDVERAAGGGDDVVLLRIGLDHVEHVTLRRGVELARELLRALALALREVGGDLGRLGRLREDEFAVRLVGASRAEGLALAERIRDRLGRVEVVPEDGGESVGTTVTIGCACGPEDATSLEFLVDAAGRALAAARREGGDRVEDASRLDGGVVDVPPYEEGAIFRSERIVRVVEAARRAARTDASVLITGETGTGKEVIANLIHRRSVRAERPFVKVNCAAFPETLLESELFGHERGAFTGAERRREGRFELADGGTLFLDEIAEMAPSAQVKLLRVLQEQQFTRLGGTRPVQVDVRIIAATNRHLENAVADSSFREDLYYRLNVIRLELPPLRERREEIPLFVEKFLADAVRRAGRGPKRLSSAAMDLLYRHPWPGNVRELKNAIERCAVMCDSETVGAEDLRLDGAPGTPSATPRAAPRDSLNERQRALLDFLARNGRCTNREYYEMTETSPRTGLRDLQDLIARGLLVREGKRRGAVYRLP